MDGNVNSINNQTNGQNVMTNNNPNGENNLNVSSGKKQKRKKKHRFLKFLLFLICIFLFYKAVRFLGNSIAQKKLDSLIGDYPFIFSDNDNHKSISEDFSVKSFDKKYNIQWKSDNDCIKFDNDKATVNNKYSTNQVVNISANYKILGGIGKASKKYKVNVLTKERLTVNDINVVSVDSVKDNSYNRKMKVTLSKNGDVISMYGDFKQSIYNSDDCYIFLSAYKETLGINPLCDFNLDDILYGDDTTTYIFDLKINNYNIDDKKVYVTIDNNDNFSVESIKCNFDKDVSMYSTASPKSDIEIYNLLSTTYNRNKDNTIFAYKSYGYKSIDNNNYLVGDYVMIYDNDEVHEVYVDIANGNIIKEVDSNVYAKDKGTMVDCSGTGVMGDTKKFKAYKSLSSVDSSVMYDLYDIDRNILVFSSVGSYKLFKACYSDYSNALAISNIGGMLLDGSCIIASGLQSTYYKSSLIVSKTNEFKNNPEGVDAYYNFTKAYDYYKNTFGLLSYNNKGAVINVSIHNKMETDNASWNKLFKMFYINDIENNKYSYAKDIDVLGHEYTHAVFGSYVNDASEELSGLNEAYADIFGIFIKGYNPWRFGNNVDTRINKEYFIRDLSEINSNLVHNSILAPYKTSGHIPYPEKYHDEYWEALNGECHAIASMIGHIAYQMYASGKFTNSELENIWYKSLTYGYGGNDTYVTCRRQILQAMDDLNGSEFNGHTFSFSKEQKDLVRKFFDEAEIFDDTDSYESTSDAVDGDLMKDDEDSHTFIVAYSPIGFKLGQVPIYLYEECSTPSKRDELYVQNEINKKWDESHSEENIVMKNSNRKIVYKQVKPYKMKFMKFFIRKANTDFNSYIKKIAVNEIGMDESEDSEDIIDLKNAIFTGTVTNTTRYKFYDMFFAYE